MLKRLSLIMAIVLIMLAVAAGAGTGKGANTTTTWVSSGLSEEEAYLIEQQYMQDMMKKLPARIHSGNWVGGHVQGVVIDVARGYVYFCFTTVLVKTTLTGELVGSVRGVRGHMGCLAYDPIENKVYASLEYKNDAIGQGISNSLGTGPNPDGFYIAIFDADKITRPEMNAETDGVMTSVFLKTVTDDYLAEVQHNGRTVKHRYGCSGIDGLALGPAFGETGGLRYLYVAYGVYEDNSRTDNDYQVILQYDISNWGEYAAPLKQDDMHRRGPEEPLNRLFVFTGNTRYGIQNLEYDPASGNFFAAVYKGSKPQYPNNTLFIIDGSKAPKLEKLKGFDGEEGLTLTLLADGLHHASSGVCGWETQFGSTGMIALGHGYFYLSQNGSGNGTYFSQLQLYRWTGKTPVPFEMVDGIVLG